MLINCGICISTNKPFNKGELYCMVKFIHCADLHLDSPFKSRSYLSQSIFDDMQKVLTKVLKNSRFSIK